MGLKRIIRTLTPRWALSLYHLSLAYLAALRYGFPSRKLVVIGVTGTKGKSTVSFLCAHVLMSTGHKAGLTSTIGFRVADRFWLNDRKMTMLGRFQTQRLLRDMVRAKCRYAIIETSSEGIAQHRHRGIAYDIAVFTNLSPEHIESHGSFERYRAAKERLFSSLHRLPRKCFEGTMVGKTIVANADDPECERLKTMKADTFISYAIDAAADVRAEHVTLDPTRTTCTIDGVDFTIPLAGTFNVSNVLAVVGIAKALDLDARSVANAIASAPQVPGRQEWISGDQPFRVMVDYAHEPASTEALYAYLKTVPHDRIIHVTGSAGGGRDVSRRPIMGELAGRNADIVVVTNEDPYDEDPSMIIDMVATGAVRAGKQDGTSLFRESDRRTGIKKALSLARKNDIVLITGKGSEQWLVGPMGTKVPWDDRRVVREVLQEHYSIHSR